MVSNGNWSRHGKLTKPYPLLLPMESSRLMLSEVSITSKESAMGFADTIRVCLMDEGGGAYLALKQADQEVTLDFDEVPLIAKAAEMLRSPIVNPAIPAS